MGWIGSDVWDGWDVRYGMDGMLRMGWMGCDVWDGWDVKYGMDGM